MRPTAWTRSAIDSPWSYIRSYDPIGDGDLARPTGNLVEVKGRYSNSSQDVAARLHSLINDVGLKA